jgi:small GTP-binding protein
MTETLLMEDDCEEEKEKEDDNDNNKRKKSELGEIFKINYDSEQNLKIEHNLKDNQTYNKSIKILLLGESKTGKTSFIRRLCFNDFNEEFSPTNIIEYNDYFIKMNDYILRMQIWDIPGKEENNLIIKNHSQSTDYAIYFYSVDDKQSFNKICDWYNSLHNKNSNNEISNINSILLGNKKDLSDDKKIITYEQGKNLAKQYKFNLFKEISCKDENDKDNILDIINNIGSYYYKYKELRLSSFDSENLSYEASNSLILEYSNKENNNNNNKNQTKELQKSKKKCCCLII